MILLTLKSTMGPFMLNSIMLYTKLLGLPPGRPGMLVFRSGSVSRIPMVDNRTALGTVTMVSGEHPSQDRSGSNLKLLAYKS